MELWKKYGIKREIRNLRKRHRRIRILGKKEKKGKDDMSGTELADHSGNSFLGNSDLRFFGDQVCWFFLDFSHSVWKLTI